MTSGDAFGTPRQMVERAAVLGWSAVALTDHGSMCGAPALYQACRAKSWWKGHPQEGKPKPILKPMIGCELYVTPDWAHGVRGKPVDGHTFHLTVLALNKGGYENLVAWTSEAMLRENFHRKPRISLFRMVEIAPHSLENNVVLSGCLAGELCRTLALGHGADIDLALGVDYVAQMKMVFPNFYIEVWHHEMAKFMDESYPAYVDLILREKAVVEKLLAVAERTGTPVVLTNDSHMPKSSDRRAHIALKAAGWRSRDDDHMSKSQEAVIVKYLPDYSYFGNYLRDMEKIRVNAGFAPDTLYNVAEIVRETDIRLDPLDKFSYSIPPSGYDDPVETIRRRAQDRLRDLSKRHGKMARRRFEHELKSMETFADYLLLMSDFIKDAKRQGILTWTRGSAANSLLCYCLEIHEIDSISYGLLFSRFFNPARKKLPDIDLDIQPSRYDDFMRIVHARMDKLVGTGQVVQICNWGTAANRKAFRMAASTLGMPREEQDEIAKLLPQMIDSGMVDEDTDVFMALKEDYPELYEYAGSFFDSIQSVSQHACAWLFGTPDRPVAEWVPLYLIASSGTLVTQYDFKTLEDFGLTKMDFLRLKTLDVAAQTLKQAGMSPLEFHDLPVSDEETMAMISNGQVEGVHTIQGKEVRRGCMEIQPEDVHDVILAAALYRPANTRENRDKLYVRRRKGQEKISYAHEVVEDILGPTLGVPVFQEQAMEICYAVGGDDEFVDDIYQAIKKAKGAGRGAKEMFEDLQDRFVQAACENLEIDTETALEIWKSVMAFQGYGFNKGHATSYGILASKVAYLKKNHPAQFYAALLDVFPERSTYLASARAEGYSFLPPDVNKSGQGFSIDKLKGNAIRVGLAKVFRMGAVGVQEVMANQPFTDMDDFKQRTARRAVKAPAIENLAQVGALHGLGIPATAEDKDLAQFQILGFCLNKPQVFRGCKPKYYQERISSSGWHHLGRERGVEPTGPRQSVSKLFWIPQDAKLELKASPWAQVKTWLLTVVDENGIPFQLMVNEDREHEVRLLRFLQAKCQGTVICADGCVRLPFLQNGPQGFRLFGLTGAFQADPQIFHLPEKNEERYKTAISELEKMKKIARAS